jgi:hypothetical protein
VFSDLRPPRPREFHLHPLTPAGVFSGGETVGMSCAGLPWLPSTVGSLVKMLWVTGTAPPPKNRTIWSRPWVRTVKACIARPSISTLCALLQFGFRSTPEVFRRRSVRSIARKTFNFINHVRRRFERAQQAPESCASNPRWPARLREGDAEWAVA